MGYGKDSPVSPTWPKKFDFLLDSCYLSEAVIQEKNANVFRFNLAFFCKQHNTTNP